MRLGRTARWSAHLGLLVVLASAGPAAAQRYEDARRILGFGQDPIGRSPRLAGMGGLTVVGDDRHNRITLWDFALNPTGIAEAESTTVFELRPGTSALSAVEDQFSLARPRERQELAAREFRSGFEGWRRQGGVAYGTIGELAGMRLDRPVGPDLEQRSSFSWPQLMVVLNGPLPYVRSGRAGYALRVLSSRESRNDELRGFVGNSIGDYIDRDGETFPPTDFFTPDEYRVTTFGLGGGASYRFGRWLEAAAVGDLLRPELFAQNAGERYTYELREELRGDRPFPVGQATLIGRVGQHLEWGWDGRLWRSQSEQRWVFTISAGVGQDPLTGRGKFAEHEQRGSEMRGRLRWTEGPLEVGGSLTTDYLKSVILPPALDDPTSFNRFLTTVYYRPKGDTLYLPDSVSRHVAEGRVWRGVGGASLRLPRHRGLVGIEYQAGQRELVQEPGGVGPREEEWDLRAGLEYRLTPVLAGRAGYIHRSQDLDELTRNHELIGNTLTLGLGLQPAGAMWSVDVGYGIEWWHVDYGDPGQARGNRQSLVSQLRWAF